MRIPPATVLALACGLAAAVAAAAQEPRPVPAKRDRGVLDDAKLLTEGQRFALEAAAADFLQNTGVGAGFAGFTIPPGRDAKAAAENVREAWFGDQDSIVLLFSRRDDTLALAESRGVSEKLPPPEILAAVNEANQVLSRPRSATEPITGTEITKAVVGILRNLEGALATSREHELGTPPAAILRHLGFIVFCFSLLAVPVVMILRRAAGRGRRPSQARAFPDAFQPARLGGAHSGGAGASIDHGSPRDPE